MRKGVFLSDPLPSYKSPPVNEVICGVKFVPPSNLRVTHIGHLWEKFRSDYPNVVHAAPIASVSGEITVDLTTGMPLPRVWFINESDDQLVQFQVDRFYYNWRHKKGEYPRYEYVIKNFENTWEIIEKFFAESDLGELTPIEYELSYTNHLEIKREWNTINDLPKIFSDFTWKQESKRFLPDPNKIAWQTEFLLPDSKGSLFINLKSALRAEDSTPLFIFELTARGNIGSTEKSEIRQWFDLAHEWIVRGFTDLTLPEVHKIWEKG